MTTPLDEPFALGSWTVDPLANEIRRGEEVVRLEPKAAAVLVHLAEREGEVVTRAELLEAVWPDVVVTDASLTRCISQLRLALGDDPRRPRLIETLPKVGYRLLPDPEAGPPSAAPGAASEEPARRRRPVRTWGRLAGVAAVGLLALVFALRGGSERRDDLASPVTVTYRIDVTGEVVGAVVTYTGADGGRFVDSTATFPYTRSVEVGAPHGGTYRLGVRGRSSGAGLALSAVAQRGDEVLAQNRTTGTVGPDSVQRFSLFALVHFSDE